MKLPHRFLVLCLASFSLSPATAAADVVSAWIAAKGVHTSGSGDVFTRFDGPLAGGIEGGIELLGIDFFGEAMLLGGDRYLFTGNLGFDLDAGDTLQLQFGVFTGPIVFLFPEPEQVGGLQLDNLSPLERMLLERAATEAMGIEDLDDLRDQFDMHTATERDLSRTTMGWNIVRLRASVGVELLPLLSIGVVGHVGYHVLISGADVAAGVKNAAVDEFGEMYMLPTAATDVIRRAAGAKPVDTENLNGFNYNIGAYARLSF